MIKLKIGRGSTHIHLEPDGSYPWRAGGNNVEAPVDDEGHDSSDQERALGDNGDREVQQKDSQQKHSDSTDFDSAAKGASGHRHGAPGGHEGSKNRDRHGGMSLDEEAKERQTSEGGPVNSSNRRGGQHSHPHR
jgi:hypothetical protein